MAACRHIDTHPEGPKDGHGGPNEIQYMTPMYNIHYTLSTTHYHAPSGTWWYTAPTASSPPTTPPSPNNSAPDTYTREDELDKPQIWGTWERRSLDTLLYIRSRNQDLGKAMYCLAKWTQRTWKIPTEPWMWKVTLPH